MTDLYQLQPDDHYSVYTGHSENHNQFLATYGGLAGQGFFFAVLFDQSGNLIEFREWSHIEMIARRPLGQVGVDHLGYLCQELNDSTLQLGPIRVKSFFLEDKEIGITRLPLSMEHFMSHESEFTEELKSRRKTIGTRSMNGWKAVNLFCTWDTMSMSGVMNMVKSSPHER